MLFLQIALGLAGTFEIVGDEFHLVIDQWQNQSAVQFTVVDIYITRTGYACHPMASGGVIDYFVPVMVE